MIDGWEGLFPHSQRICTLGTLQNEIDKATAAGVLAGTTAERARCVMLAEGWLTHSPLGIVRDIQAGSGQSAPDDPPKMGRRR